MKDLPKELQRMIISKEVVSLEIYCMILDSTIIKNHVMFLTILLHHGRTK
ncbi:MAG: hypothetical protein ACI8RD_003245 [Bacillariaceae sp.]|jgi:hypothetical protein